MAGALEIVKEDRKALVDKIISMMESGYFLQRPEWNREALRPHNPLSNVSYKGGNRMRLMLAVLEHGYGDPCWATGRQYMMKGYHIKKGEHGILCEKWIFDKEEKVKDENGNETTRKVILTHPKVSYFRVFNAQQVEDFPSFSPPPPYTKTELETVINHVIDTSECPIRELAQERAFYSPSADEIILPIRSSFKDEVSFAKTLIHEMAHSTGHPTRLNRPMGGAFGSPAYAREELRAEIGALFTEADLGIRLTEENYEDHSDYLKSWIGALKDDYNEFFHACSDAEKICGRIVSNYTRKYELTRVPDAVPEYAPQLEKGIVSENETSPEKKIVPESETNPERVATSDHGIETEKKPGTRPRRKEKTL